MGTETIKDIPALTARARAALTPDNIPAELKALRQWVCWKYSARFQSVTKPPIDAKTGMFAKSDDPATWATFGVALDRFNADKRGVAGIGLMLAEGDDLVFIDIDDRGATHDELAEKALGWFTGTYAETSPAGGFGAHIICRGQLPGKKGTKEGIFEAYTHPSSRYLTFTGQRLVGHSEAVTVQQDALGYLHQYCLIKQYTPPDPDDLLDADCLTTTCPACGALAEYPDCESCGHDLTQAAATGQEPTNTEKGSAPQAPPPVNVRFDPEARLQLALLNAETRLLYSGDLGKYGDRSRAELALCQRLMTFADGDTDVVADWLNASGCGKWLERGKDTDGYRASTLAAAVAGWDEKPFVDKRQADIDHGRLLAEALLKGRDKPGQAGHSEGDTGQPGVSRSSREPGEDDEQPEQPGWGGQPGTAGNDRDNPLFVPVSRFIGTPAPPQWTVRKWLPASSMAVLFGEPGCGKSFLAVDWCCHVATGLAWNGNRVKQGAVLYIAGEGHYGLKRRFATWQQQHGVIPDTLYISERAVTLDPAGAKTVFEAVGFVPEVPVLIVVDTLSSVIAGDENNAVDMNAFLTVLKKLLVGTAATILVVHHTGHGSKDRARGHSSLKAALDAEFRAERCDGQGTLACTKPKDMEPPKPLSFELTQVELPDAWRDPEEPDEPVTSCIFTVTGNADGKPGKAREVPASQKIAMTALHTALVAEGGTFAGQFAVHIDAWRKAAYDGGIADTADAKKKAFQRTRTSLLASGDVKCNDDLYWFADAGKQNSASLLNTEKRKQKAANAYS